MSGGAALYANWVAQQYFAGARVFSWQGPGGSVATKSKVWGSIKSRFRYDDPYFPGLSEGGSPIPPGGCGGCGASPKNNPYGYVKGRALAGITTRTMRLLRRPQPEKLHVNVVWRKMRGRGTTGPSPRPPWRKASRALSGMARRSVVEGAVCASNVEATAAAEVH